MYVPSHFEITDPVEQHRIIRECNFGILTTVNQPNTDQPNTGNQGLMATHLPFVLDAQEGAHGTLYTHMAKANPQWRSFDGVGEALIIFSCEHGYVSPNWYTEPGRRVPTWNYVVAHAYGCPEIISDGAAIREAVSQLVASHESKEPFGWSIGDLDTRRAETLLEGVVVFKIPISRIEAKAKLDQNKTAADRQLAADALDDMGKHKLAAQMRRVSGA